jgi:hypothetical protein
MTTTMHRPPQSATGPPGRTAVSGIVIVTTSDLTSLVRRPDGAPISDKTPRVWAQAGGGPTAVLTRPVVISTRPVWSLTVLRERLPKFGYSINEEYAARISKSPAEGGRAVPGPVVLIGGADVALLLGVTEETVRYHRMAGTGRTIPAALFELGSEQAQASGKKLSPIWSLADIEAAGKVNARVARRLRSSNLFER